ncbi:MAG: insulinase family protein [Oscillospiraceae bacterium]|nr:insulinase family protein [Oscillospiraceae bacterium]
MTEKITLPNGVRMIHEHIPHVRSVSIGLWLGVGSRYERLEEGGASHYIEHLLFKGTKHRTAAQLAEDMDQIGGQINAFTTKECTCFYGRVLDTHIRMAVDILADMLFHSNFHEDDIQGERSVIYEEIDMYEDTPEDLVSEQLMTAIFPDSALGRPILGTRETLQDMDRGRLLDYMATHYVPNRLVVAISGSFTSADLDYMQKIFSHMPRGAIVQSDAAAFTPAFVLREKSIEQNHLCLLMPGLPHDSQHRYTAQLLSNILGGGMSSRLFQTIREQHGLCYSIYSFGSSYRDTGLFGVYTALNQETEVQALQLILEILQDLRENGVTDQELDRAREQVKSNVLMSLESTSARMNNLGKYELYHGAVPAPEEIIARYDGVTKADILAVAQRVIGFDQLAFSAVGQATDEGRYREVLGV